MSNLSQQRFYAAKSEPITRIEALADAEVVGGTLMIARVHRPSGSDLYQLLVDAAGNDVLATEAVSTHLVGALAAGTPAGFGTFHTVGDRGVPAGTVRPLRGEQSNTSLIVGDSIVKFFRRLEPGINPDVELLVGLSATGCAHIVPVRGWVDYTLNGETYVLAVVQDFLAGATGAWDMATTASDFSEQAHAIGVATRAVHDALASAFPTSSLAATEITRRLEQRLGDHLRRAPLLAPYADYARELYRSLGDIQVPTQRIHGDLHLGQILHANGRYVLIDFEGEPAISLAKRRKPDSPLRDLAGLIRSLDYAGHAAATPALLAGYGEQGSTLMDCFVLDKALYEVAYEVNNRPDWVNIPLRAVHQLTQAPQ